MSKGDIWGCKTRKEALSGSQSKQLTVAQCGQRLSPAISENTSANVVPAANPRYTLRDGI